MTEIEWWEFDEPAEMAEAVAGDVGFILESALDARGQALAAFPGGKTPEQAFAKLAEAPIRWKGVTIVPADDRLVKVDDPHSNVARIAKAFLPRGARVLPLVSEAAPDVEAAGRAADARLKDLHWPPDCVWLGMGADGHVASIFPGPDLERALKPDAGVRAVGVRPDPMPAEAPVARVTLTAPAITSARTVLLMLSGADKRAVLERAIEEGDRSTLPVGRLLSQLTVPVDIYWSP